VETTTLSEELRVDEVETEVEDTLHEVDPETSPEVTVTRDPETPAPTPRLRAKTLPVDSTASESVS
jgi:hypothetical protein